ncbi:MAG: class I SAM-dependent methyltransferase [Polyangiaceae bacterium]
MSYGKLGAWFYDLNQPTARPDALEFYLEYARASIGPILEPMCGTGRYLLPIVAEGLDVSGTDASNDMLTRCRSRADALGLAPSLRLERLEELDAPNTFGLVFIPSGSFSLLIDGATVRRCLARIYECLLPGGTFVVEIERAGFIRPSLSGPWEARWLKDPSGATLIQSWVQQYSGVEGIARSIHRYELVVDGKLVTTEFEDFAVKHYELEAFAHLLEDAGFSSWQCIRPYGHEAPDEDDEGLVFECRKS